MARVVRPPLVTQIARIAPELHESAPTYGSLSGMSTRLPAPLLATTLAALVATVLAPSVMLAQPAAENAEVWAGLLGTPAGALSPILVAQPDPGPRTSIAGRLSGWRVGERSTTLVAGVSLVRQRDSSAYSLTAAILDPGCACPRTLMGGLELTTNGRTRSLARGVRSNVALRGSGGFGATPDDSFVSLTAGLSLAVSAAFKGLEPTVFVIPEMAWADVFRSGPGVGGIAPVVSGGLSVRVFGQQLVVALTRVMVEGSVTNSGMAVRWKLGD